MKNIFVVYQKGTTKENQAPEMFFSLKLAEKYKKEVGGYIVEEQATKDIIEYLKKEEKYLNLN